MRTTLLLTALICSVPAAFSASPTVQLRVTSPYLDVVERYRSGDHVRAVDEVSGFPTASIRERARRDLTELPCQVLCGIADCARAKEQKPRELARVLEVWTTTLPAAAALHIDAAVAAQKAGRLEASSEHQRLALELADLLVASVPPTVEGHAARVETERSVWLIAMWLLQLRLELKDLEMLLVRARQTFPGDGLVLLASGAFHEVQARPYLLLEASEGRQGNLAAWRLEERTWRLKSAEEAYRNAITAAPGLEEAHLRLGRVLGLQGRYDDAHASLARVPDLTPDTRWRYLSLLFRASAYEAEAKTDASRTAYRAAIDLWPSSQAARLGLSRLQAEGADWAEARKELEGLGTEGEDRADPWWAYDFGQAWRLESGLAELRKTVSR